MNGDEQEDKKCLKIRLVRVGFVCVSDQRLFFRSGSTKLMLFENINSGFGTLLKQQKGFFLRILQGGHGEYFSPQPPHHPDNFLLKDKNYFGLRRIMTKLQLQTKPEAGAIKNPV